MPRRKQRFSQLEKQFRDSGGTAAAGSRLEGYINFKKGVNKIEIKNKLTAADRKRYAFAVLPFGRSSGAAVTPSDRYLAPITAYSNAGRTALGLSKNQCGYEDVTAATVRGNFFYPAVICPSVINTAATGSATPISGITKKDYKRVYTKSYGIPFGRTITGVVSLADGSAPADQSAVCEEDVKLALTTALNALNPRPRSISYLPEEFKSPTADLVSPST